ncbi:hypothetical protein SO802_010928 [Lithocarpus litseifolius]|uniref:Disease resistance protein winged helix domain-containing protein n=1 Tax=Lithocarpus litseifolius TaxID=425828 RepID=A0AAW2DL54_9ROSI
MADIKKKVDSIRDFDTLRICPSPDASSSTTAGEVSEAYNSFSRNDCHVLVGIQRRVEALLDRVLRGDQPRDVISGSKIIISTRNRNLASVCLSSHDYIYDLNLNPLTWEEALELLCKKVFQGDTCPDHLVDWCEKIVIRCEESPHAIVAVGNFLSNKPHSGAEFKNVLDSLEFDPGHLVSLSCYRIFLHSYYHLLPKLKSCFLYFCNFPMDHSVTCGRLIHQWIGCGFIEKKECKTLEQVAYEYLDELVQMSMVHVTR